MKAKIYGVYKDGEQRDFNVILTFKSETTKKDYVVYTDNTYDNENKLKIYASIYNPFTGEYLGSVETKQEWNEIYNLLDDVLINNKK